MRSDDRSTSKNPNRAQRPHGEATTALLTLCLLALLSTQAAQAQLGLVGSRFFEEVFPDRRAGHALAVGDFDGNGYTDFAIGRPNSAFGGDQNHGSVVLYRQFRAESETGSLNDWVSSTTTITYCESTDDHKPNLLFGTSLVFGHFNDDDLADLAIGMPGAAAGAAQTAGAVCVIYGGPDTNDRDRFDQGALAGVPENGDEFGAVLAAGDLTGDGLDELVVGVPGEDVGSGLDLASNAGAINYIESLANGNGLSSSGNLIRHQGQEDVPWLAAQNERFGSALAIGHFFLSGGEIQAQDLAVGTPGDFGGGTVTVFAGSAATPLSTAYQPFRAGNNFWNLVGTGNDGDDFGASLAAGDFNGDGGTDLAIGIPGDDDIGPTTEAGAVMVLYGTGGGSGNLSDNGEQVFYEQIIDGHPAGVNNFDRFGERLAVGDFNDDGSDDLAIGSPYDNSLGLVNSGEVTVLHGSTIGLEIAGHQLFNMIFFDTVEIGDEFGFAMAAGPTFDGRGTDLLVGVPGRAFVDGGDVEPQAGGMVIINSTSFFADGFETGSTIGWTSVSP